MELWNLQKQFNDKFWDTKGGWPQGEKALTDASKDFAIHMVREISEILDELNSKMHRKQNKIVDTTNVLEEIVDVQKFLFGLTQLWGFTWEQFEEEFKRKSMVVEQRFAQEQQLSELQHQQVVIIDIDGVLSNYPTCFYDWLATDGFGNTYQAQTYYESLALKDRLGLKKKYRQSGVKANLPVLAGAREMLNILRVEGLKIVLLTNRPYAEHYRIYPDTLEWLYKNDLKYDAILWARDKGIEAINHFSNICWAVDDEDENIIKLKRAGIATIKLDPYDPKCSTQAFSKFLEDLRRNAYLLPNAASAWNAGGVACSK